MFVRIARTASLLAAVATALLVAVPTAQALTCPKCYCQPRLCNWATYGYYPTEWRPWPQAVVVAAVPPHLPPPSMPATLQPTHPQPLLPYRMLPTRPGDLRNGAEELKMPLPVKPK